MSDFKPFAQAVRDNFTFMSEHELFVVDIDPDDLFAAYLAAFPEGTNPIFRERTEHDCSCCRNFIKHLGPIVAIIGGERVTVWDLTALYDNMLAEEYQIVAGVLAGLVKAAPIKGLFRSKEPGYGAIQSLERREDGTVHTWNHFHGRVASRHASNTPGQVVGDYATTAGVFKRGLEELNAEAFNTVIELIGQKSLYKGDEFLPALRSFRNLQSQYKALEGQEQQDFIWANAGAPAARFRNTAIGTLIVDLSDGIDLEPAVKAYESKVAPENYKRPSALITPRMIEAAVKTIDDLGLRTALERRYARLSDVSVNNVLWVDSGTAPLMKDALTSSLMSAVAPTMTVIDAEKAHDIDINDFMANVLPGASSIELVVRNSQQANFVSLTAPMHAEVEQLFKWDNNFAWSYDGNITDSIREKVKRAGGKTDATLRVSLAWFNLDDLDLHIYEPSGRRIYFGDRRSPTGGELDVDMNRSPTTREPVENTTWANPPDGKYRIVVNNYTRRETSDPGFMIEVENAGKVQQFSYAKGIPSGQDVQVGTITVKNKVITAIDFAKDMIGVSISQAKWGVATEVPVKVTTIMRSPNYWDENAVGNKHWFFMLDGCKNDQPTRGIYNEFLSPKLEQHRKVLEVLGNKTMCQPTDDQLSGVGFSSTRGDTVLVSVTSGKSRKAYNITF